MFLEKPGRINKNHMRISPEPLHPLRNWRELWQPERLPYVHGFHEPAHTQPVFNKQPKQSGFHWLSHLFSRNNDR